MFMHQKTPSESSSSQIQRWNAKKHFNIDLFDKDKQIMDDIYMTRLAKLWRNRYLNNIYKLNQVSHKNFIKLSGCHKNSALVFHTTSFTEKIFESKSESCSHLHHVKSYIKFAKIKFSSRHKAKPIFAG